ncbi:nuclease-related domain-containing protein [Gluconobacter sphaericus]|uniref:nuclease-related domain-containing protein n=1 Tax=Gluconobacter sphaericus TaxID=574987 RepID=UPI001F2D843A|nr:nuclease-related domain-containing protein [Gluconobacter sphaericus]
MGAWWSGSVTTFLHTPPDQLCAALAHKVVQNRFQGEPQQARAWEAQIDLLHEILSTLPNTQDWQVLFEFPIPRLGGRIDTVLVSPGAIYVLEFKIGSSSFDAAALSQTEGYALDLLDFHAASRKHPLVPVLVATDAPSRAQTTPLLLPLGVTEVQCVNAAGLNNAPDHVGGTDGSYRSSAGPRTMGACSLRSGPKHRRSGTADLRHT